MPALLTKIRWNALGWLSLMSTLLPSLAFGLVEPLDPHSEGASCRPHVLQDRLRDHLDQGIIPEKYKVEVGPGEERVLFLESQARASFEFPVAALVPLRDGDGHYLVEAGIFGDEVGQAHHQTVYFWRVNNKGDRLEVRDKSSQRPGWSPGRGLEDKEQGITIVVESYAERGAWIRVENQVDRRERVWRINAGGKALVDSQGLQWMADQNFEGGNSNRAKRPIEFTQDDELYQTERWGKDGFSYTFAVPPGRYSARLLFAELFTLEPAGRLVNVKVNGVAVVNNFDIYSLAGGPDRRVDQVIEDIHPVDGRIKFEFTGHHECPDPHAKVAGIELRPLQHAVGAGNHRVPGIIQAEDFDAGGEGVAYSDTSVGNLGLAGRLNENVDMEICADEGGGLNVGWMRTGEWLEYTIDSEAGRYRVDLRVAAVAPDPGTVHISLNGVSLAQVRIPQTGGWQRWTTHSALGVDLPAVKGGVLRVRLGEGSPYNWMNLNWMRFVKLVSPRPTPQVKEPDFKIRTLPKKTATPIGEAPPLSLPVAGGKVAWRINAGGPEYRDSKGRVWSADSGFEGGNVNGRDMSISQTSDPTLYQTERWGHPGFKYTFPVIEGKYRVTLKFAEIFTSGNGQRLIDIKINGQLKLARFDAFALTGGLGRAVDRQFDNIEPDKDKRIVIEILAVDGSPDRNAKISALSVVDQGLAESEDQRGGMPGFGAARGSSLIAAPNPATDSSVVSFELPYPGHSRLHIANTAGEVIQTVDLGYLDAGRGATRLDLRELASGVLILVLEQSRANGWAKVASFKLAVRK